MTTPIRVNLHCHSTFSDGYYAPEAVAERLARWNVQYAALVDHDTTDGIAQFKKSLYSYGIGFVSGVEITLCIPQCDFHLLAYGIDIENMQLQEALAAIRKKRENPFSALAQAIRAVITRKKKPNRDSAFSSEIASDAGVSSQKRSCDEQLNNQIATLPRRLNNARLCSSLSQITEMISIVHLAGGKTFLAHPLFITNDMEQLDNLITLLKPCGLDGIEALYQPYSRNIQRKLLSMTVKHRLLVSAGSDFHGTERWSTHDMGVVIPHKYWQKFVAECHVAPLHAESW